MNTSTHRSFKPNMSVKQPLTTDNCWFCLCGNQVLETSCVVLRSLVVLHSFTTSSSAALREVVLNCVAHHSQVLGAASLLQYRACEVTGKHGKRWTGCHGCWVFDWPSPVSFPTRHPTGSPAISFLTFNLLETTDVSVTGHGLPKGLCTTLPCWIGMYRA